MSFNINHPWISGIIAYRLSMAFILRWNSVVHSLNPNMEDETTRVPKIELVRRNAA